ncbi:MAG: tetratricopeptide repeat protein [Gemmataceae bacterium]
MTTIPAYLVPQGKPGGVSPRRMLPFALPVALTAALLVGAAPLPSVDDTIRRGNEAFTNQQYEEALEHYRKAELKTLDPGLVAFNQGATLYRLGRFAEAALAYERCLEDDAAPLERRQKAFYDLGAALLKQSKGDSAPLLRRAVDAFRSCLALDPSDANLKDDARYNFELAQRLWLLAQAKAKDGSEDKGSTDTEPKKEKEAKGLKEGDKKVGKGEKGDGSKETKGDLGKGGKENGEEKAAGARLVVPDAEGLKKLPAAEMRRLLADQIERISHERKLERDAAARSTGGVPNW